MVGRASCMRRESGLPRPARAGAGGWVEVRHLCRPCHSREKAKGLGKHVCQRCHLVIEEQPLMFRSDAYHPDHFSCTHCRKELTAEARELFFRLRGAPRHPEDALCCGSMWMALPGPAPGRRGVSDPGAVPGGSSPLALNLGPQQGAPPPGPVSGHCSGLSCPPPSPQHFVCAKCEKPFRGHRHYERKGLAYCETHYSQLFGDVCYSCSHVIEGDVLSALNKAWCASCFSCSACHSKLTLKNKFVEFDMKPVCKRCYEHFPLELKKRLKKLSDLAARKTRPSSP
ncbi:PREDICTED: LIM and senescent cell antigen-like-containing domain protein 2 [Myotis davidii]|uniref:LIM and senescent cell antigen-like-containing domain protein 2 n=1 Tax=Myotis davidii TaxID=225400 RepID=UPI0007672691|nr:PREDICTED: LIM and senescent cell antigen-like-containing domain protein 2 [Myotis davidii]